MIWLKPLPRRYRGDKVHYDSVLSSRYSYNQRVKQCVKVPILIQNKTGRSGKTDRCGVHKSMGCTVVTLCIKNTPNPFTARILLLYFSPGNKDPLKHPQSTPSGSGERMDPFKMQFFSLCPCVPIVNAVCPLCDKRPLHKRASPLREWSTQLVHCVRPDAA